MRARVSLILVGLAVAAAVAWWALSRENGPTTSVAPGLPAAVEGPPSYVGAAACTRCHPAQAEAWKGSHHDRAMEAATPEAVLGDFDDATFSQAGLSSRFFRRDGGYFVHTDGPDGGLAVFPIRYTLGFFPLQQYLVELPGGRLQALGIAWDARARSAGGQRWFHLYANAPPRPGSAMHWTGVAQTWNHQCADCHSTHLVKGYDADGGRYDTTWTDPDVACEACHGPGSRHVEWARDGGVGADPSRGLTVVLDERRGVTWVMAPGAATASRSTPRSSARELEVCARCHSRRQQLTDAWHSGQPFLDGFRPSLLEAGAYFVDGQAREEVYTWASFLTSRMHARGVTCSDCHEPHSGKLRAPGNLVCAPCHAAAVYDAPAHHHHKDSAEVSCVQCHLSVRTFMTVDPRHDHSFRIPRPDRSDALGVPDACRACHQDRPPGWTAEAVARWFPSPGPGFQSFAEAFEAADRGGPGARGALAAIINDATQPAIVRASALERLGLLLDEASLPVVERALGDRDPLLRAAAAEVAERVDGPTRARWLAPLLGDPIRDVRLRAARSLAGEGEASLSPADRARFERVLGDWVAAERFNFDRAEARANVGELFARRGQLDEAVALLESAVALDPEFAPARLNLADLYRALGREGAAERTLRDAIAAEPTVAQFHYALGLALRRQRRNEEAARELEEAARLAPDDSQIVHALALLRVEQGKAPEAMERLARLLTVHPNDRQALLTLAQLRSSAGQHRAALELVDRLRELEPGRVELDTLRRQLEAAADAGR
ncbi:MAG: tetratricopeptide repeat protein [Myxococcota bacterium]